MINNIHIYIKRCSTLTAVMMLSLFASQSYGAGQVILEQRSAEIINLEDDVSEIFVADPEVADIQLNSPRVAYVYGKKLGTTSVIATTSSGKNVLNTKIHVVHNTSSMRLALRQSHPNESIKITSTPTGLLLTGQISSAQASLEIESIVQRYLNDKEVVLNNMRISAPNQVYLQVKVAEISRSVLKQLDFNWDITKLANNFTLGLLTGRTAFSAGAGFARNAGTALNTYGFNYTPPSGRANISGIIDALNQEGLASVLAEPNLVAMSGETANVLVGGEFPFPVPQDTNITIEFKKVGISLSFSPTILSANKIHLKVKPEVSEIDRTNGIPFPIAGTSFVIPSIKTRSAETSIELGSGESFAIAGLHSNSTSSSVSEVPGLANIPVLGALFRSTKFQRNETELVIIVTPYIIKPVKDHSMKLPTDNLRYASHIETILTGRLNNTTYDMHKADFKLGKAKRRKSKSATMDVSGHTVTEQDNITMTQDLSYTDPNENTNNTNTAAKEKMFHSNKKSGLARPGLFDMAESYALIGDAGFYTG